ncbi:hypothetical protein PSA7680_00308 [Pseudoruegeria aquimaris]|uniref:Uncharacterized protein n=1 Tax=Pseudoruegeria aquimaris TaxID=393663 RepID=A0A1Y5RGE7_9RHOB|nr:hypothetical protein [Pseudoruegeria aquimaris]SLN14264.1 hypothetical protein PSA7680_00308 [Pseudoruegeria aquimaris]
MAFEQLKAAILMLLDEIEKAPEDSHVLQEELREKLSEMKGLGMPLPDDLVKLEEALERDLEEGEDPFDNMPV